jgi:hypothetical protein
MHFHGEVFVQFVELRRGGLPIGGEFQSQLQHLLLPIRLLLAVRLVSGISEVNSLARNEFSAPAFLRVLRRAKHAGKGFSGDGIWVNIWPETSKRNL